MEQTDCGLIENDFKTLDENDKRNFIHLTGLILTIQEYNQPSFNVLAIPEKGYNSIKNYYALDKFNSHVICTIYRNNVELYTEFKKLLNETNLIEDMNDVFDAYLTDETRLNFKQFVNTIILVNKIKQQLRNYTYDDFVSGILFIIPYTFKNIISYNLREALYQIELNMISCLNIDRLFYATEYVSVATYFNQTYIYSHVRYSVAYFMREENVKKLQEVYEVFNHLTTNTN